MPMSHDQPEPAVLAPAHRELYRADRPGQPVPPAAGRRAAAGLGRDFSHIPAYHGSGPSFPGEDKAPDAGTGPQIPYPGAPYQAPKQADAPKHKPAGVDSFKVDWTQSRLRLGPEYARFRLEYFAKFTKDATHDPAFADFRQNAFHTLVITDGPHKGQPPDNNGPLHDDHYSRADADRASDVYFESNDNPGNKDGQLLDKDDVIDYSFTAEQMIIDTGNGDKVIAKLGPHTATIKGKHPRTFDGVPVTLTYR